MSFLSEAIEAASGAINFVDQSPALSNVARSVLNSELGINSGSQAVLNPGMSQSQINTANQINSSTVSTGGKTFLINPFLIIGAVILLLIFTGKKKR